MSGSAQAAGPGRASCPSRWRAGVVLATGLLAATASGHDLFFRSPEYVLAPGASVTVDVLNGTFSRSENAVTRDRLAGLVLVSLSGRQDLDSSHWTQAEPKSTLRVALAEAGTHVLGAAVKPRLLGLPGKEFSAYLKEEGLDDVLAARAAQGRSEEPSRERYSKHLKAVLQAGDSPTDTHSVRLGHGAEIVPEQNPYRLAPGDELTVVCLVDGQPWAGQTVFAGGRRGKTDARLPQQRLRTDAKGRATVRLTEAGVWYVKLVAMRELAGDPDANYESKWATLTFAVGARREANLDRHGGHAGQP